MRRGLLLAGLLLALPAVASWAHADAACDPAPIGRCGAYQRERVMFCFDTAVFNQQHRYVSGTDGNVVVVGTSGLPPLPMALPPVAGIDLQALYASQNFAYVRLTPTQDLLNDPYQAPLPTKSVWKESNSVPGLQMRAVSCAQWVWYAECRPQAWMGPFGSVLQVAPDTLVA